MLFNKLRSRWFSGGGCKGFRHPPNRVDVEAVGNRLLRWAWSSLPSVKNPDTCTADQAGGHRGYGAA